MHQRKSYQEGGVVAEGAQPAQLLGTGYVKNLLKVESTSWLNARASASDRFNMVL